MGQEASGTCTDLAGNISEAAFMAGINIDKTPPVITPPDDQTLPATSIDGAVVTFVVTAADGLSGVETLTGDPVSGYQFPIGKTTVAHTAVDMAGNIAAANHTVDVLGAQFLVLRARDSLAAYADESKDIAQAVRELDKISPGLWTDPLHLNSKDGHWAFDRAKTAVIKLDKAKGVSPEAQAAIVAAVDDLLTAFNLLATMAVAEAAEAPVDNQNQARKRDKDVATATDLIAQADSQRAAGDAVKAIDLYRRAWDLITGGGAS
tara:strand:+ start:144 stop:932 length:789 start_codon:yes stop_codon:yes gene_type:complete